VTRSAVQTVDREQTAKDKAAWHAKATEQQGTFQTELADLKQIRSDELMQMRQRHEDELDEMRCSCAEQVATVTANRTAVMESLTKKQRDDSRTNSAARELAATYEAHVEKLKALLEDESRRLTETREQLCTATVR
jgi:hypothetical protein